MKTRILTTLVLATAPAFAQLAPPNSLGSTFAHVHLNTKDVPAQQSFWATVGGKLMDRDKLPMIQFPGALIVLRKQDPTGGSVGSVVNHFGLFVRDFDPAVAKWKAAGLKWEDGNNKGQGFLTGPDEVRIEIYENKTLKTPMAMHHVHMYLADPLAAQKWYLTHFGGTAGKRGQYDTVNVPGAEITFAPSPTQLVPTKGRSIDHIGFEVTDIDQFVGKLRAAGVKTDGDIRTTPNAAGLRLVYLTDPWGTEIEITQNLPPKQ